MRHDTDLPPPHAPPPISIDRTRDGGLQHSLPYPPSIPPPPPPPAHPPLSAAGRAGVPLLICQQTVLLGPRRTLDPTGRSACVQGSADAGLSSQSSPAAASASGWDNQRLVRQSACHSYHWTICLSPPRTACRSLKLCTARVPVIRTTCVPFVQPACHS